MEMPLAGVLGKYIGPKSQATGFHFFPGQLAGVPYPYRFIQ